MTIKRDVLSACILSIISAFVLTAGSLPEYNFGDSYNQNYTVLNVMSDYMTVYENDTKIIYNVSFIDDSMSVKTDNNGQVSYYNADEIKTVATIRTGPSPVLYKMKKFSKTS